MNPTPRTDLMVSGNSDPSADEYADLATFCRQLERELAEYRRSGAVPPGYADLEAAARRARAWNEDRESSSSASHWMSELWNALDKIDAAQVNETSIPLTMGEDGERESMSHDAVLQELTDQAQEMGLYEDTHNPLIKKTSIPLTGSEGKERHGGRPMTLRECVDAEDGQAAQRQSLTDERILEMASDHEFVYLNENGSACSSFVDSVDISSHVLSFARALLAAQGQGDVERELERL